MSRTVSAAPTLHTARLRLRRPYEGDIDAIVRLADDWEVASRLGRLPHPYTHDDARFFLEEIVPAEWAWAIEDAASGALLGMVGLTPGEDGTSAELGYWLGREHWGRGFATEAAGAVVRYAREGLRLATLTSAHFTDNPASGRVLGKLGFSIDGHALQPCLALGRDLPSTRFSLPLADTVKAASASGSPA